MSTAAPTIPPRPSRAHDAAVARGVDRLPEIPPRPTNKRLERSVSPGHYPSSPLNEPWKPLTQTKSLDAAVQPSLPKRPSVQHLPSLGQEGMEYSEIQFQPQQPVSALGADAAEQTRNVAEDLHLHAPKPLPNASAIAKVQAVTRTDSSQAVAHGIGKPPTPSHDENQKSNDTLGRVRSRASFSRPNSSASGARRASVDYAEEQGPAELGMRVPINPLLGDVQAPSPAPFTPSHSGQNGEPKRRGHFRTQSGKDTAPPGSYGLHGHGVAPADPFEKDWYAKHPEELQHEEAHGHGVYEGMGSGRGAFALSSDDLNKIVRNTASRGSGFGTSGNTMSYPDEQIGYLASAQYSSQPATPYALSKTLTNASQPAMESPLRKASLPAEDVDPVIQIRTLRSGSQKSEEAIESGNEAPIHIDQPKERYNKVTGGQETIDETQDAKPYIKDEDEDGYSVPILAADEVAKGGDSDFLQPAVSPRYDRRSSPYDYGHGSGDVTPSNSRPSSRPGSIYGLHSASHSLSRFISHHDDRETVHTPLEDVDEYEPLFPDDDSKQKALSHAERFRPRPDALKHRFPSQDIWEDAPSSVMHETYVSTPDIPEPSQIKPSAVFEPPENEAAGKGEVPQPRADDFLTKSRPHLKNEVKRPELQPRFPSSDIWEDSPESYHQFATVGNAPVEETAQPESQSKPIIPPRPTNKSRFGEGASSSQVAPSVPPRPQKTANAVPPIDSRIPGATSPTKHRSPTELRKVPSIPDRPKPQVPPRPTKKTSGDSLGKIASKESADSTETGKALPITSPPLSKPKPQIPARPAQAKFNNIKGNFMSDLNQKLGLGPPKEKEKEPEPEIEAKPLEDARKGRARGPQRRAPAKSPAAAPASSFSVSKPLSLWQIDDTGLLTVGSGRDLHEVKSHEPEPTKASEDELAPTLSSEKAEQMDHATIADAPAPPTLDTETEGRAEIEEQKQQPADTPEPMAPILATNIAGEYPDPGLGTPTSDKANSPSDQPSPEGAKLSQRTTEASEGTAANALEREEPDPNTDAIPVSKQTTASTATGHTLEKFETEAQQEEEPTATKAAEEPPIELRNEQVSAPAPGASMPAAPNKPSAASKVDEDVAEEKKKGADTPKEPMPEEDVSYAKLEEMTKKADGKELSDGGVKKVVD